MEQPIEKLEQKIKDMKDCPTKKKLLADIKKKKATNLITK